MPSAEQWRRQAEQLQGLGVNVYVGETTDAVLFTLIEALIASITHLQRHDGAIEALAEDLRELRHESVPEERPLTLEEITKGSDATDAPSPS